MARTRAKSSAKTPSGGAPDARLRALHAVPPTEFTAARDALARELAAEGSADAPRVKRLRRPTLPVWLLNALARERPEELGALLATGDRLRQAQVRALRGDTADLRTATADLSEAIADLLRAAAAISAARLGREPAASLLGDVERGLRAAATADASERAALVGGVLDHVPEPGGLELLAGLSAVSAPRVSRGEAAAKPPARAAERARQAEDKLARTEAARRDRERRRAAAEAERLERAERQADARVREAERAIEDAQRRLASARNEADRARASARSARERADAAHRS